MLITGVVWSYTDGNYSVATESRIKKITGPRINKELSAGLNGSVSVSGHCHDRRVLGFDSPFSSKYI